MLVNNDAHKTADVAAYAYSDYALTYSQLYKCLVTSSCYRCVSVFLLVVKKVIGLQKILCYWL